MMAKAQAKCRELKILNFVLHFVKIHSEFGKEDNCLTLKCLFYNAFI